MLIRLNTLIVVGLVFLLASGCWSVVVVDENFNGYSVGSQLVGQGGWILGGGAGTSSCRIADVCTDPPGCPEPQLAGCWQAPSGNGASESSSTKKAFPVVWSEGVARLYISIMFDAVAGAGLGGNTSYVQILDDKGNEATRIYMSRADGVKGHLMLLGRSGSTSGALDRPTIVQDPVNGVWYHIKMEVDAANRRYDVYLGDGDRFGANEGHWNKVVDDLYFYYPATNLASVCWQMYHRAAEFVGPGKFYIDNLYIDGPDSGQAVRSTEIWVAGGICQEQVTLAPYVSLYGGFAGNERTRYERKGPNPTVIDPGDPAKNAITAAAMSSVDGFTIKGANYGVDCAAAPPTLTNNVITGNVGAGIFCGNGTPTIRNNIVVGNAFGIQSAGANPQIANNIVVSNSIGLSVIGGSPSLSHNNLFNNATDYSGTAPGPGDISEDPVFVDGSAGDYHLTFGSPCIDAGDPDVVLASDHEGGYRPVDGDGDGVDVIDMGPLESQFTPGLKYMRVVKREGDRNVLRIERAVVTAVWPDYFYVEADDRSCGIRVERPGHGLQAGMRANVSGRMKTDLDGERCIEAIVARQNGTGSIEPLGLSNVPLGGNDYSYESLTGAGQMGAKAWRWVWKPELKRMVREFGYAHGPNNVGLLVKVWGRVTWSQGSEFYIDDGSRFDDYETTNQAAPSGVKVVLPAGITAPVQGDYLQVVGISSCYRLNGQMYRLLRVPSASNIITLQQQ